MVKKHKELHHQLNRHSPTSDCITVQGHPPSPTGGRVVTCPDISGPSQLHPSRPNAVNRPRPSTDKPPNDIVSQSLARKFDPSAVTAKKERLEEPLSSHNGEVVLPDGITASEEPSTPQDGSRQASTDHLSTPSGTRFSYGKLLLAFKYTIPLSGKATL